MLRIENVDFVSLCSSKNRVDKDKYCIVGQFNLSL